MRALLIHTAVLLLIGLAALSPFLVAMGAGVVAEMNGCTLNEGDIHPCVIGGRDQGESIYTLFVLGWLGLATIPIGAIAAAGYVVVVVAFYLIRRLRRPRPVTP